MDSERPEEYSMSKREALYVAAFPLAVFAGAAAFEGTYEEESVGDYESEEECGCNSSNYGPEDEEINKTLTENETDINQELESGF